MEIKLNLKGTVRKDLVKLISETLGVEAQYQFMPTCNYVIGDYTLTPEGTLIFAEHVDAEQLLVVLKREGFIAEEQKTHDTTIQNEPYSFVVNIPTNFVNMPNLKSCLKLKVS